MISAIARLAAGPLVAIAIGMLPNSAVAQSQPSADVSGDEIAALHARIDANIVEAKQTKQRMDSADGELRAILERRLEAKNVQIVDDVNTLGKKIIAEEKAGKDVAEMRKVIIDYLKRLMPAFRVVIEREKKKIIALISEKQPAETRDAMVRELRLSNAVSTLVDWYSEYQVSTESLEAFGMDAVDEKEYLTTQLRNLSELLADTIGFTTRSLADLKNVIALTPDDTELQARLKLAELRRDMALSNLSAASALLAQLDVDVTDYKSLVLKTSGDVSTGVLETGVWAKLLNQWGENAWTWFTENSLDWLLKALFLVVILYAARALSRLVRRVLEHSMANVNLSSLLRRMIVATAANAVLFLGVLIALSQVGVSIGPLLAGLGIAGIIVGFALQDTLSNFASGLMILLYRPYDVGDLIDAGGELGTVTDMSLVSTVILTIDNQKLVIPNNLIWRGVIRNVTAEKIRRVDMTFGISYDDDIPKAERIFEEILNAHELVLDDPEPMIRLHSLGESSVDFIVRPWVKTEDYWDVYWSITREVKLRFDAEGITIPYPQRDVHVHDTVDRVPLAPPDDADQMSPVRTASHEA